MSPNIPVTPEEEIYWQEIGQRVEIMNQNESLFTVDEETWRNLINDLG